jgi:predicted nucleotidyltransferase
MTLEEIIGALRAGATALTRDHGVLAMWVFGPAVGPNVGPVVEVDLLLELLHPADVAGFIALRRKLEALLGGLRVEPVLRPNPLPDDISAMLVEARRVF